MCYESYGFSNIVNSSDQPCNTAPDQLVENTFISIEILQAILDGVVLRWYEV